MDVVLVGSGCVVIVEKCPAAVLEVLAVRGQFVEGSITPPVAGLSITITGGDGEIASTQTMADGKYRSVQHGTIV